MNLKNVSARRPAVHLKRAAIGILAFSALGFLDATYLTVEHYRSAIPPCSLASGCETVLTSAYATVGGVPIALAGAAYYLAVFSLAFAYLDGRHLRWLKLAGWLAVLGFAVSLVLVYLQLFIIKALCPYCLLSAGTSAGLFILGLFVLKVRQRAEERPLVIGEKGSGDWRDGSTDGEDAG